MRLFLASSELGSYAGRLRRLAGSNRRVLIIRNARDYRSEDYIANILADKTVLFLQNGFDPQVLDLRQYFGKPGELEDYLDQYDPGVIYCLGGNPFLLNAALYRSGMDDIIRKALINDAVVYAGESAGTVVAARDLAPYQDGDKDTLEISKEYYGFKSPLKALGLIDTYPVPHINRDNFSERTNQIRRKIAELGSKTALLEDTDVIVVDGKKCEILR